MDKSILKGHLKSGSAKTALYGGMAIDQKLVTHLVKELNNTRRQVRTYPKGHPAVDEGISRLMKMFDDLFAIHDPLMLSISEKMNSRNTIFLDRRNPIYKDIAAMLFDHGIMNLTFKRGLTPAEVLTFCETIAKRKEKITEEGGLDAIFSRAGLRHVTVQKIDQKAFRIKEYQDADFSKQPVLSEDESWIRFARALVTAQIAPDGNLRTAEAFARSCNMNLDKLSDLAQGVNQPLLRELKTYDWETLVKSKRSLEKVQDFVSQIDPQFCAHLLRYTSVALAERPATAEEILSRFPVSAIIAVLTERSMDGLTVPPTVMKILTTLVPQNSEKGPADPASQFKEYEIFDRFRTVLEEEDSDKYTPDDYSLVLQTALREQKIRPTGLIGGAELKSSLQQHNVERHLSFTVLNLLADGNTSKVDAALTAKLASLCDYFLGVGDFATLSQILDRSSSPADLPPVRKQTVAAILGAPEFVGKMLSGLETWDKSKFPEVGRLISQVGEPFVEPLLERVADEERLYLRRFCLDQLIALGPLVREAAVVMLGDERWYVVRNIVLILAKLDDPSVCDHLHPLVTHPHHRVRQEVIRALLPHQDPLATEALIAEMSHKDRDLRLDAIKIAGKSRDPEIRNRLLKIMKDGGLAGGEIDFRIAAVHALSDIADPSVLPVLADTLQTWSFFKNADLVQLKTEILKSLILYPPEEAAPLLRDTARTGKGSIADIASAMLRNPRYSQI